MIRVSREAYLDFVKGYLIDVIKVPSYRFGQAFLNAFPEIDNYLQSDGDNGIAESSSIWNSTDAAKVKSLIELKYVETL